jgi:hypothetical protein
LQYHLYFSIVNGTKGTDDFYSGGTVTLLNSNNTSNLTYTLSEEKPLYVGRFYNYDNIDELNNNEDLIKNVALKFNDTVKYMEIIICSRIPHTRCRQWYGCSCWKSKSHSANYLI